MNNVSLLGRLTKDPELRYTQGGQASCRFTLAVDRGLSREKRQELEANNQPTADFISITTWGKTAELVANYLSKGRQLAVEGSIRTGSYENKEGQRVYTTEVWANRIHFISDGSGNRSGGSQYDQSRPGAFQANQSRPMNQAGPSNAPVNHFAQDQAKQAGPSQDNDTSGFYPIDNDDIPF
ncbi:single-stranded DNA-binding protein [Urinicoccus massiliensis]|uniref:single-stranded DNA-binding protein n=1 Tax=Urinicoccus massiliensis TaxID=1723382 RepID=UPI000931326D|nr:single-stranded DNA-binding protein [Urinicoccus massiliensis]